jgi:TRAP-type C4-dicarboxylate transport system permease small subunit
VPPRLAWMLEGLADIIGLAASLALVWYGTVMTVQSARLGSLTIKNLVFPEWWLLAPLPLCFALLVLEFVMRFHRLMGAPRTRRVEATSVG